MDEKKDIDARDYSIDEFEKLYAIVSAIESAKEVSHLYKSLVIDENFKDEDFNEICNLAEFRAKYKEHFRAGNQVPKEGDLNYYIIPQTKKIRIKNGDEYAMVDTTVRFLNDNLGNNLYIIMEDRKCYAI